MPVTITSRTQPPSRGVSGDIDTLFVPAKVAGGKDLATAFYARSLADYEAQGLVRADNTVVYDGLDNYFREGGRVAVVATYVTLLSEVYPKFTTEHGGGQIVAWSETPVTAWTALAAYAASTNRYALGDVAVTDDTNAELLAAAAADVPTANKDVFAAFGPWVTIGPLAGSIGGGNRQVPASSTVAALIARADALGNPNVAPAGRSFPLQNAVATSDLTDSQATALRVAGVNPLRKRLGLHVLDGFRTYLSSADPSPFWQANAGRARMWLQWNALGIGLNYEYKTIDGRGRLTGSLAADLRTLCKQLWEANGLYGNTPSEAYAVEVGVSVNTDASIAQGQLNAVVEARFSQHAETVRIELVSVPITGAVA